MAWLRHFNGKSRNLSNDTISFSFPNKAFKTFLVLCRDYSLALFQEMFDASGKHVRAIYTPLPHFYIAKLGYAGVYLFFLFLLQNIDCGYSF